MGEDVGETSNGDDDQVKMDLEITILMKEDQENVVPAPPLPEQENLNEDVDAHIDKGDIAIELHLL